VARFIIIPVMTSSDTEGGPCFLIPAPPRGPDLLSIGVHIIETEQRDSGSD